jgi:hypothetical protein
MALVALMATASLAACDDGLGVDGPANVAVSFRSGDAVTSADLLAPAPAGSPLRVVTLDGANGTLVLDEVYMIVDEVELDTVDDDCDDGSVDDGVDDDGPSCADFELGPRLVALPLDGSPVQAFETSIAPGVYDELEFEIEHMDDDEDDLVRYEALRAEILALIPDWPAEASIYVAGTFQADGADPVEFRAFVDAEIEIELGLTPSLEVGDDGLGDRDLVVDVRPDLWFGDGQGGVMDLTAWDFDETGQVLELELEIEDGFIEVELND